MGLYFFLIIVLIDELFSVTLTYFFSLVISVAATINRGSHPAPRGHPEGQDGGPRPQQEAHRPAEDRES